MGTADHVTLLPGHSVSSDGQYNQPVFNGFNGRSNTPFISTEEPRNRILRDQMISCFIEGDALLPLYRIKRKSILGLKIYVVIGGFSLLADALLQGSSVLAETFSR